MKQTDLRTWAVALGILSCLVFGSVSPLQAGQTNALDLLKAKCEQAKAQIARDNFCAYSNNVAGMVAEFKKKGDLGPCLLLMKEQKSMASSPTVPTGDARELLTGAISGYGEMMMKKLDADNDQHLFQLRKLYVAKLAGLLQDLMTADKMDEAKVVNAEKERVEQSLVAYELVHAEDTRPSPVETKPPAAVRDVAPPGADTAKTPKALANNLVIIKATITSRSEKSRDVTEDIKAAVVENELTYADWDPAYRDSYYYGYRDSLLTIQYRFGSGMMKTIQARKGATVHIVASDKR